MPRRITLIPSKAEPVMSIPCTPFAWPWSIAVTFLGRQRVGLVVVARLYTSR